MRPLTALLARGLVVALVGAGLARPPAAAAQDLSAAFRANPKTLQAFRPVVSRPSESAVRVRCAGKDVALGTVVAADGWILTKASELSGKRIVCRFKDGRYLAARLVGVQ